MSIQYIHVETHPYLQIGLIYRYVFIYINMVYAEVNLRVTDASLYMIANTCAFAECVFVSARVFVLCYPVL